jgi:FtsH-binding integral membrane protein
MSVFSSEDRREERLARNDYDELSPNLYNLAIGVILCWGFFINALLVAFCADAASAFFAIHPWIFFGMYFVVTCIGIALSSASKDPLISFIGYNLVVVPVGVLVAACLQEYDIQVIEQAIVMTGIITLAMTILSTIYPDFFASLGLGLFISLALFLVMEFIAYLLGYTGLFFDYIFTGIFSLYIGYDWVRAQSYSKTLDNAVDSAVDLYLDIINLFLRILEILGDKKKD